jgi:hypothetical protein
MDFTNLKKVPVSVELLSKLKEMGGYEGKYFLITHGSLKNCILEPTWTWSKEIYFNNEHTGRSSSCDLNQVFYLPEYNGNSYYPPSIINRINKNIVDQGVDKYGGTVAIDSYVAYMDSSKSRDEGLRVGIVTKVTKANRVDVIDVLTGELVELPNSKRYFVIDEGLLPRLMVMKISQSKG